MSGPPRPKLRAAILGAFPVLVLAAVVFPAPRTEPLRKPEIPIDVEALISGAAPGPFDIEARASSRIDAEIDIEVLLPEGMTLLAGERARRGRRPGLRVQARDDGGRRRTIFVRATIEQDGARLVRTVPLALDDAPAAPPGVLKTNSQGRTDPRVRSLRCAALVLALSSAAAAQVSGQVRYQDRVYDAAGFTGAQPYRPVRHAEVEIVRAGDGASLGTGVTDDSGAFSIGGIPGNTQVYARVYARRAGGGINASVRDNRSSDAVYAAVTSTITTNNPGNGTLPILDLAIAGGAAPAFNIFDAAVKSFEYQASVDADLPSVPPPLILYWQAGSSNGTYYSFTYDAIFLLGASWDPDQYDDDIILHEIAHWVAQHFSRDDSPGGAHSIIDQLDPRLSWSEGFAHYWSAAVRRAFPAEYAFPSLIVDNTAGGASTFDIEGPSFPGMAVMATNELAVAAAMWDITDASNEGGFDLLSGNEAEAWRSFNDRMPGMPEITLEDFRDGLAIEKPSIMADVTGDETTLRIMNARSILYYPNLAEPDGAPGSASPLPPAGLARRTIYPSGDADWYAVDLTAGLLQAETFNLGDGANTLLQLYGTDGATLLGSNDDRGPGIRSSLLQFPILEGGTYYLRITRSGNVVENGYYDIRAVIVGPVPPPADAPRAGYCAASAGAGSATAWGWIAILILALLRAGGPRRTEGRPLP